MKMTMPKIAVRTCESRRFFTRLRAQLENALVPPDIKTTAVSAPSSSKNVRIKMLYQLSSPSTQNSSTTLETRSFRLSSGRKFVISNILSSDHESKDINTLRVAITKLIYTREGKIVHTDFV